MELHELIATFGGLAVLLTLQSHWIGRALSGVERQVDHMRADLHAFRAENHADMATHTSAIADLRDRVVRLES